MRILSIETSVPGHGSWALVEGQKVVKSGRIMERASAGLFQSLSIHRKDLGNVNRILVGVGPGSYSSIRVAIACAQGLRMALGGAITPMRSCGSIAQQFTQSFIGIFAVAKNHEFFVTYYKSGQMIKTTQIISDTDLRPALKRCELALSADNIPGTKLAYPNASTLALSFLGQGFEPALPLEPIYLRQAPV